MIPVTKPHLIVPDEPEARPVAPVEAQQAEPDQEEDVQIGNSREEEIRNVEEAIRNFDDMLIQLGAEPIC